jgi:hypothetical protein
MVTALLISLLTSTPPAAAVPSAKERSIAVGDGTSLRAAEVLHTAGVWEGRIVGNSPWAGGWVMEIETNSGTVLAAQGPDGSSLQRIPVGGGAWRVVRSDGPLAGCGGATEPVGMRRPEGGTAGADCDDGTQIDVLVKWTPGAESGAGGPVAIRAVAEAAVAVSNHVYAACGVAIRMRAVGYSVTEPYANDAGNPLGEVTSTDDGLLDGVHAERDAAGADLVALLTAPHPNYCGVAYLLGGPYAEYGFSVTVWSCALGGLTFTHEVGHNQGCCHAPGDGGGCTSGGVFPYSVGHRFTAPNGVQYRTVMAYSPGTRIPRLSSPVTVFAGSPTGLAEADNARTLNETAVVMANYRCSVPGTDRDHVVSPILDMPELGGSARFTATAVPRAKAGTDVDIVVFARGDIGQADEALLLRIGATNIGTVIGNMGNDCGTHARRTSIPSATFNAAIGTGASVEFTLTATSGIEPGTCNYDEARVTLRYTQAPPPCTGDLNGDANVDGADIGVLLGSWGACTGACAADLNGDGAVTGADLGVLLGAWGACPQ